MSDKKMSEDEIIADEIGAAKGFLDLLEKELSKYNDLPNKMAHIKPLTQIIMNSYYDLKRHGRPNYNYEEILNKRDNQDN